MSHKEECTDLCKKCKKCKCDTRKFNIFSGVEIIGWIAIAIGTIGAIAQFFKTRKTKNLGSFSIIYLVCACIAEITFLIQGIILEEASIAVVRIASSIYFGFFIIMFFMYEMK